MKKFFVLLIFIGLILIGIAVFLFLRGRESGVSALQVTSIPKASVLFDGKEVGKTPFRDNVASGEHTVKISPEGLSTSFEQKLSFLPNILTVIERTFDQGGSSGYTLSLLPLSDSNEVQVTILSTPSGAAIMLDSELRGITPLAIGGVTVSDHELLVRKEGYQDKIVRIKAVSGYKLLVNVDLGVNLNPTPQPEAGQTLAETPTPTATPSANLLGTQSAQLVEIGKTPNNFLRVREEPSLSSKEITRVKPGETFTLLDEQSGWFKILLPDSIEGWVSSLYAQKISE